MLDAIKIIFSKELLDNFRDRRSLVSAMISSLLSPLLLLVMIAVLGKTLLSNSPDIPLIVPVSGAEHASSLIQFLKQNGVQILPAPPDPEGEIRKGNADVILQITDTYEADFSSGQPAGVILLADTSRTASIRSIERVQTLLQTYSLQIAALRLVARGVSPLAIQPLSMQFADLATPQSQVMIFLGMMPFLLLITIFSGGMFVIIDMTAGERERNSLEPLLINPVPRWQVVVGKFLAALPFLALVLFATLVTFAIGFDVLPVEKFTGIRMTLSLETLSWIFIICLPIILFAAAIQMVVATFTHSYKEAQTYVGLMSFIPALPGAFISFLPTHADIYKMLVPTFGQQLLINQMLRGEDIDHTFIIISAAVTVAGAALLLWLAIRLYQREQVLFGSK